MTEPWQAVCIIVGCGVVIDDPDNNGWQEVTGWEKHRAQGGTNHVALRRPTGRFMCSPCMRKEQDGAGSGHLELFPDA